MKIKIAENMDSSNQYWNYVLFCVLYSTAHGAVDAVLAYSTAELGSTVGSNGSFALYILYTTSALLLAKPTLKILGPKNSIFVGLCGMLIYVASFFIAIQTPTCANMIFTTGGVLGGIGAGLLWPAQGAYFYLSSVKYAKLSKSDAKYSTALFAAIFATFYLGLETIFKIFSTIIYLFAGKDPRWHIYVFGVYTAAAYCSVVSFGVFVPKVAPIVDINNKNYKKIKISSIHVDSNIENVRCNHDFQALPSTPEEKKITEEESEYKFQFVNSLGANSDDAINENVLLNQNDFMRTSELHELKHDILSVIKAIKNNRLLQLMLPYQISFGLSAGFIGFYINNNVVAAHLGDGYIGILSGLSTLCAALLPYPFAILSKYFNGEGKYYIMIFGGLCFCTGGLAPLCLTNIELSKWSIVVIYYVLHGIARGCWESTNKAVIVEYFTINGNDYCHDKNKNNNKNNSNNKSDSDDNNDNDNNNNNNNNSNNSHNDSNNNNNSSNNNNDNNNNSNDSKSYNDNNDTVDCDTAFSAVYFTSGLSGAVGYCFYQYMTRNQMVLINFIIPIIAVISYHYSYKQFLTIRKKSCHDIYEFVSEENNGGIEVEMKNYMK